MKKCDKGLGAALSFVSVVSMSHLRPNLNDTTPPPPPSLPTGPMALPLSSQYPRPLAMGPRCITFEHTLSNPHRFTLLGPLALPGKQRLDRRTAIDIRSPVTEYCQNRKPILWDRCMVPSSPIYLLPVNYALISTT